MFCSNQNQTFQYIRHITPKLVTSMRCPSPRHSIYLRKCWSGGEPFATLCKIWPVGNLNFRPPTHVALALTVRPSRWYVYGTCFVQYPISHILFLH